MRRRTHSVHPHAVREDVPVPPTTTPSPLPHGRTARRVEWHFLPPALRREVEARLGSPVVEATSQRGGFTPGMASVLRCADGSRHFVKAASTTAQRAFAASYREEARKIAALPAGVPAPRLRWVQESGDWVVLCFEHVAARAPRRPWGHDDLAAALDLLETTAAALTPPPGALALDDAAGEFADFPGAWEYVRRILPDLPHREEAAALAARYREVVGGGTLVHTDVRDDNLLVRPDGSALLCDWNWPCVGAAWIDTVMLMIGPRGDGLDVDAVLARRPLTRDVPAEHVDILLALLAGYFSRQSDEPVPPTSPYLRAAQRWQAEVVWDWLCERRGWS
jgi:hypothetical protein